MHEHESSHFFRRTARRKARQLSSLHPLHEYRVEWARRGPYHWAVYRVR